MTSSTKKWRLLCLRGGTVIETVVYTSETLLRRLRMPSLAHLLLLISAWSALVTYTFPLVLLKLPVKQKTTTRQCFAINYKIKGELRHEGIITEQNNQNCSSALLQLYIHMLYICTCVRIKRRTTNICDRVFTPGLHLLSENIKACRVKVTDLCY